VILIILVGKILNKESFLIIYGKVNNGGNLELFSLISDKGRMSATSNSDYNKNEPWV
jgi:hypothetical protein